MDPRVKSDGDVEPRGSRGEVLFYDGHCGFCHGFVRLAMRTAQAGEMTFAPIGGAAWRELAGRGCSLDEQQLLLLSPTGAYVQGAQAVLQILCRPAGWRQSLCRLLRTSPPGALDAMYWLFARVRRLVSRTPPSTCPVAAPAVARRFDLRP